jgi:outer membrane protein OmpA-like peptidoglycan-associated protein
MQAMYSARQLSLFGTIALVTSQLNSGLAGAQQLPSRLDVLAQAEPSHPGEKDKNDKHLPGPPGQQKGVQQKPAQQQPSQPKPAGQPAATKSAPALQTPGQDHRQSPGTPPPGPTHAQQQPSSGPHQQPQKSTPSTGTPPHPPTAPHNAQQQQPPTGAPQQSMPHAQPVGIPPHAPTAPQNAQQQQSPSGAQQPATGARPQLTQHPQPVGAPPPGSAAPQNASQIPGQAPSAQPAVAAQRIDDLHKQRREHVENNRTIIEEPGRVIVQANGHAVIRHDETERFRLFGGDVHVERRGAETVTVVPRPDGVEIVTVVDAEGRLVRRVRRTRDGREFVLIENRPSPGLEIALDAPIVLPPPRIVIPREEYILDLEQAPPQRIVETLEAPPIEPIARAYTLDEIRYSPLLRDRMRRVDLDTINFESGSWQVDEDQVSRLEAVGAAMNAVISRHPNEMFLVEGHTDAVGSDVDNLSLSDRHAESVALVLTQSFQVPPENIVTQGYGSHELKVPTAGSSRENRRVTVRRVTPLLTGSAR